MTDGPGLMQALVKLGLCPYDAERLIGWMNAACGPAGNSDSLVLLAYGQMNPWPAQDPFLELSPDQIAAAADGAAVWQDAGEGRWQYLCRMALSDDDLCRLLDDLVGVTQGLRRRAAGA